MEFYSLVFFLIVNETGSIIQMSFSFIKDNYFCHTSGEMNISNFLLQSTNQPKNNMSNRNRKVLAKVVILGNSFVGKTSVLQQYISGRYNTQYKANIGADFWSKDVSVSGNLVTLQLWDTAGQERFHSMGTAFYRGSDCCVLVFDVTNRESFKALDSWKEDFLVQASPSNPNEFPFVVIGNKVDLVDRRVVSYHEAKAWCDKNSVPYFETSAMSNIQVDQVFAEAAKAASRHISNDELELPPVVSIQPPEHVETCTC
eukprot:TRINITY_DN9692_c0_g1_i1.p1 TRINITY_DN9692_c0_g1~~TRINITY_DN9692_c0_g1_i1.p1  ORF type:complete len:257 (-),score=39.08 TRINITY_DN9692_c0_g1_i1:77-847(-)